MNGEFLCCTFFFYFMWFPFCFSRFMLSIPATFWAQIAVNRTQCVDDSSKWMSWWFFFCIISDEIYIRKKHTQTHGMKHTANFVTCINTAIQKVEDKFRLIVFLISHKHKKYIYNSRFKLELPLAICHIVPKSESRRVQKIRFGIKLL